MSTLILSIVLLMILYYKYTKTEDRLYLLFLAAFLLRVLLIIADNYLGFLPYSWDTDFFHRIALLIKDNLVNGRYIYSNINESIHVISYSTIEALVYLITGSIRSNMRIVNAFIGVMIGKKVYDITYYIFCCRKTALFSAFLTLFWPSFLLFTSLNMREAIIIYATFAVLFKLRSIKQLIIWDTLQILLFFIILFTFKIPNIILAGIILILMLLIKAVRSKKIKWQQALVLCCVFLVLGMFAINMEIIPGFGLEEINAEMQDRTRGGSKYLAMEYKNSLDIFLYLPQRMIYFLFGPFLWDIDNIFIRGAGLEGLVILIMTGYYLVTFLQHRLYKDNYSLLLLLFMLTGIAGNAVFDANFGTAFRHRMPYIVILFIYISPLLKKVIDNVNFPGSSNQKPQSRNTEFIE